jgi:hypothetical protein
MNWASGLRSLAYRTFFVLKMLKQLQPTVSEKKFKNLALQFGLHAVYFVILLLHKDDFLKLLHSNVLWVGCDV